MVVFLMLTHPLPLTPEPLRTSLQASALSNSYPCHPLRRRTAGSRTGRRYSDTNAWRSEPQHVPTEDLSAAWPPSPRVAAARPSTVWRSSEGRSSRGGGVIVDDERIQRRHRHTSAARSALSLPSTSSELPSTAGHFWLAAPPPCRRNHPKYERTAPQGRTGSRS